MLTGQAEEEKQRRVQASIKEIKSHHAAERQRLTDIRRQEHDLYLQVLSLPPSLLSFGLPSNIFLFSSQPLYFLLRSHTGACSE